MKIGVWGLGSIGSRHARNLQSLGCEVIGYDIAPYLELARLKNEGEPIDYNTPDKMKNCDGIVIATPTNTHHDILRYVIKNFKAKTIFIEKPVASSSRKLRNVVRRMPSSRNVFVGHNLRFHSCVIRAKKDLPKIGNPIWAHFTVAQYTDKAPYLRDGVILNWGVHEIDVALHLLGPGKVVSGYGDNTMADFVVKHDRGCISTFHVDYLSEREIRSFVIQGEKQIILADLVDRAYLQSGEFANKGEILSGSFASDYVDEMGEFIQVAKGRKNKRLATLPEGIAALKIAEQAMKACGI